MSVTKPAQSAPAVQPSQPGMWPSVTHVTTIDMSLRYLLLNQLGSIAGDGYEVAGISAPGPDVAVVEAAGVRHLAVPMARSALTPLRDLQALFRLYLIFRRERFTIVHTHTPKPGLLGQLAAKMAGVPIIINTIHGFYFHEHMRPLLRRFHITLEKIAARCSDVILFQNPEDIETAVNEGICSRDKTRFLGNGIDVGRFDPARVPAAERRSKRSEVGLPADAPVVGFVGRLVEEKGLVELFRAVRIVRETVPDVRFLFVGPVDTDKRDAVAFGVAAEHGVADPCVFVGLRDDMPELYSLMDLLVLPSHREGFPRAPMEASAMEVPCIVTDIRGCRETVEHGRNGLRVPLRNAEALAAAIRELLHDPVRARRMGKEGRRLALERFDERLVFERVKTEYRRLLVEKSLPLPSAAAAATDATTRAVL